MLINYLKTKPVSTRHLYALFALSIVMWLLADFSHIPGVIAHPQFTEAIDSKTLTSLLTKQYGMLPYYLFFLIDCIWAPVLMAAIWMYVKRTFYNPAAVKPKVLFGLFTAIALIALGIDFVENYYYSFHKTYLKLLSAGKMIAYGLVALSALLVFFHFSFKNYLKTLLRFLKASVYSLVILVVLGSFLPKATQVNSIVVNLYERPLDLIILFLVAPTFAVVLAHYPSYFYINEKYRHWYMANVRWGLIGTIFYKYNEAFNTSEGGKDEGKVNFLYRILGILFYTALFYMLGYTSEVNFDWPIQVSKIAIILLACGIIALYRQKKIKDEWYTLVAPYLGQRLPGFYDGDNPVKATEAGEKSLRPDRCGAIREGDSDEMRKAFLGIKKYVNRFVWLFTFTVLVHIGLVLFFFWCEDCRYTQFTSIWSLLCIALQLFSYVYYRTYRSVLRFVFYKKKFRAIINSFYMLRTTKEDSKCLEELEKDPDNLKKTTQKKPLSFRCKVVNLLRFFEELNPKKEGVEGLALTGGYHTLLRNLGAGALSNNVTFLQFTILIGIINALFFLIININSELSLYFNPILIILSALFFYYGFVVVISKSLIYYRHSCEAFAVRNRTRFTFLVLLFVVGLLVCNRLGRAFSNELFTLPLLERKAEQEITLEDYVDNLPEEQTRYYVNGYGGGMKSNAWTMTVLKAFYDRDPHFFKKTVGISGASGGTIGWANMAAIVKCNKDSTAWGNLITDISTENILSLDLTHILGRDTFNHMFVPGMTLSGEDRSSKAMARYAKLTNNADQICKPTPYREYWKKLYEQQNYQFPILISNSTNVKGKGGMAVSVRVENDTASKLLYRKTDNILEIYKTDYNPMGVAEKSDSLTLSFYNAVSTSNRFPLLSPAAKIETKGHFNDGGVYENSGILSALKLFHAVNFTDSVTDVTQLKQRNVFINIVNDKNQYIMEKVKNLEQKVRSSKINKSTEISAILASVAATEMFPLFAKSELERLSELKGSCVEYYTIYLPHRFDVADIKAIYGDALDTGNGLNAANELFYELAKDNDQEIRALLDQKCRFGDKIVIEPPMSRVMADEAYAFMRKMIGHSMTLRTMDSIVP